MRGTLFLVVGPSGAGKDALIAAARARLDPRFLFPKRAITRPVDPEAEDHVSLDDAAFDARERAGEFALSWRAHGLAYGIPASIDRALSRGTHVVANVSRGVVDKARATFAPAKVILVTAPAEVLRSRLILRGRESGIGIGERLARPTGVAADVTITNDGALETALQAFVAALEG